MEKKVGIVSLGCPKNLVDSEIMLGLLQNDGFNITPHKEQADVIVVNTCGFIDTAKEESINTILEMCEYKKDKCQLVIVTGCLAERYREQVMEEIPEIDAVVGTGNYEEIAQIIKSAYQGEKTVSYGKMDALDYLKSDRVVSTKPGVAYLKIAEGCDNCCTYCIIPSLRGQYRSRPMEDIVSEAEKLSAKGVREIILIAQDTTRYGMDLYKTHKLVELLKQLSAIEGIAWIRLLYCYPEEITSELINEIAVNSKVLKYIDVPIQHMSDKILKAMGRRGSSRDIRNTLRALRTSIPDIIIRTSIIVGFPGEDEQDFETLYDFVESFQFERLGVFSYSREEDTPAAKMKNQVPNKVKEQRNIRIMELQNKISIGKNKERLGKIYKTMVEGVSEDGIFYTGRTYAEAPDIDGIVYFTSAEPLYIGNFVYVKILNSDDYDLIGEVVNEAESSE